METKLKKYFWTAYLIIAVVFGAVCFNVVAGPTITGSSGSGQPLHAALTSIAGLTEADVSILETTADNAYAVVTSGGNNYILGSNAGNTALEFKTPANVLSEIGGQAVVTEGSLPDSTIVSADIKDLTIASADLANVINSVNQTASVDDAGTLTPTAGYARVFIGLTAISDPSAMTLSETGAADNVVIYITNVAANTATFTDSTGVQEIPQGTITLKQTETAVFWYDVDRWVHTGGKQNTFPFSSFTTTETEYIPITALDDGTSPPAAKSALTSTNTVAIRNFDGASNENLQLTWKVPEDIVVASGVKFQFCGWVSNATQPANTEIVAFSLGGRSFGNSDILSGAVGSAQTSSLTADATYVQYDSLDGAWSSAITITDLAVGEKIIFTLIRLAESTDTYAQDFGPCGVNLKYVRTHDATF